MRVRAPLLREVPLTVTDRTRTNLIFIFGWAENQTTETEWQLLSRFQVVRL